VSVMPGHCQTNVGRSIRQIMHSLHGVMLQAYIPHPHFAMAGFCISNVGTPFATAPMMADIVVFAGTRAPADAGDAASRPQLHSCGHLVLPGCCIAHCGTRHSNDLLQSGSQDSGAAAMASSRCAGGGCADPLARHHAAGPQVAIIICTQWLPRVLERSGHCFVCRPCKCMKRCCTHNLTVFSRKVCSTAERAAKQLLTQTLTPPQPG